MSDQLDDEDISKLFDIPMSSEVDREMSEDGWGSNAPSEADDTDEDPDFVITDDEQSMSESDNDHVHIGNDTSLNDTLANQSENDVNTVVNTVSESDGSMEVSDSEDNQVGPYISLAEKFKNLNKMGKEKMKKEENDKWVLFEGKQQSFVFAGRPEYKLNLPNTAKPIDFFLAYVNDEILTTMVTETNRNAAQVISSIRMNRSSRLRKWRPTDPEEMKKFLGLLLYMGLVPMPKLSDYWSRSLLYRNLIAPRVMGRNRFQLLLRFWHFNNNETIAQDGRLAKIAPLVHHLNQQFNEKKSPGMDLVVDESMIPFRGRLIFRQYLPKKTHKYGIKIFKICDTTGYTLKMKVYMGKGTGTDDGLSLASSVVMDLMSGYLDKGYVLYVDNFYTSVDLANLLLERKTHLVGTVISNRAWLPHKKTIPPNMKLEKGQMISLEYPNGLVYTRWQDKREVKMMSTKHAAEFVDTGKKTRQGDPIMKPLVVDEYNKAKMGIDLSDQMASYSTAVRKSVRWYHKAAEELLLGTTVVNAWLAYKDAAGANAQRARKHVYSITTFREKLVHSLLDLQEHIVEPVKTTGHHYLAESSTFVGEGKNRRRSRKNCKVCYQKVASTGGRKAANNLKKVTTLCEMCPQKPYLCKDCFKQIHK